MAKKEYDSFMDYPENLMDGEMNLVIRELTPDNPREKYLSRYVRAQICQDPEKIPGSDILWFRWQRGRKYPKPFGIKIKEELGETLPKKETIFRT